MPWRQIENYDFTYSRRPNGAIQKDTQKEIIRKWQRQLEETQKGEITKSFFFSGVERRLAVNLNSRPNLITIMTGHGNIRSCLHQLKITGSPECPCKHGTQTADHLIFQCEGIKNKYQDDARSNTQACSNTLTHSHTRHII